MEFDYYFKKYTKSKKKTNDELLKECENITFTPFYIIISQLEYYINDLY